MPVDARRERTARGHALDRLRGARVQEPHRAVRHVEHVDDRLGEPLHHVVVIVEVEEFVRQPVEPDQLRDLPVTLLARTDQLLLEEPVGPVRLRR